MKNPLTKDDAIVASKMIIDYFDKYKSIEDYMREQKLNSLSDRSRPLFGLDGPEEDLFSDFSIHPKDMEFELVELRQSDWDTYLNIISSHTNMTSIPGRGLRLAVQEKNTKKWVGFIRLGSPLINMKPRNEMLGSVFSQSELLSNAFNNTTIMGFVIVPAQPFGYNYLGGKLLAAICCSHWVRERINQKYGMNTCMFETTSLYGSSKQVSQYDGMKPYIRFKGITESNFMPLMHGKAYEDLKDYVEMRVGVFVPPNAASRKLKVSTGIVNLIKTALKGTAELEEFKRVIEQATNLTEKKRYYVSNYGFSNYMDVVTGKTNTLIPDKENYEKFKLENIIEWWKKKAANRYESLIESGNIRNDLEVWTRNANIDIMR